MQSSRLKVCFYSPASHEGGRGSGGGMAVEVEWGVVTGSAPTPQTVIKRSFFFSSFRRSFFQLCEQVTGNKAHQLIANECVHTNTHPCTHVHTHKTHSFPLGINNLATWVRCLPPKLLILFVSQITYSF